jgi:hypothetical protein
MKKIYILIIAICLGCIANGQIISTVAGEGVRSAEGVF